MVGQVVTADDGWWNAPPGQSWTCPDCGVSSPVQDWAETETACEDCGTHDARRCPACGEPFDHVRGSAKIAEATAATAPGRAAAALAAAAGPGPVFIYPGPISLCGDNICRPWRYR